MYILIYMYKCTDIFKYMYLYMRIYIYTHTYTRAAVTKNPLRQSHSYPRERDLFFARTHTCNYHPHGE